MSAIAKVKQIYSTITRFNDEPRADPGLDRATIIDRISSVGLSPPEAVISLYEWKNGISNLDAFLHLNDLDFAVDSYKQMCAFKQEFQDFEWQRSWLPILNMNGDIHICLDL